MSSIDPAPAPVAPRWHTALLVGLMLAVAVTGLAMGAREAPPRADEGSRVVRLYLPMIVVQWGLVAYACRAFRARSALGALVGRRWTTTRRAAVDLALAAVGFAAILVCEIAAQRAFGAGRPGVISTLLPHTPCERLVWVLAAASAGFCEEVVYRGYLQTQVTAFSRSRAVGVAAQALLFGLAHGQQGLGPAARFAVYGVGFGLVAAWRRSLVAGIVCHVLIDATSGLVG